jgi:hypothetical protein
VDLFSFSSPILGGMSRYTKASHQVYMYFQSRGGWHVQFLEVDLKTPLPRQFTFQHADKLRELARRGEALGTLEQKQALEHGMRWAEAGCIGGSRLTSMRS